MKLVANKSNLKKYAKDLLGNNYTPEKEKELIDCVLNGYKYTSYRHASFDERNHLEKLDEILGNCGVEGALLNKRGEDVSGNCCERDVYLDIQYSNTGDSYNITLMYVNGKLCIADWGSIVERLG